MRRKAIAEEAVVKNCTFKKEHCWGCLEHISCNLMDALKGAETQAYGGWKMLTT